MSLVRIVAQNLATARRRKRYSQETLARKARVSISYISMLERGERTPPLDTLESLAKALGMDPIDLLRNRSS